MNKVMAILVIAALVVSGYLAFMVLEPVLAPSNCRIHVQTIIISGPPAPMSAPAPGVTVSVVDGPSGETDKDGFLELRGVKCGRDLPLNYGGGLYKSGSAVFPEGLVLGPRDICVSGWCPLLIPVGYA